MDGDEGVQRLTPIVDGVAAGEGGVQLVGVRLKMVVDGVELGAEVGERGGDRVGQKGGVGEGGTETGEEVEILLQSLDDLGRERGDVSAEVVAQQGKRGLGAVGRDELLGVEVRGVKDGG